MNGESDDSLGQLDCELIAEHGSMRVVMLQRLRKVYDRLKPKEAGRLQAVMKRWCLQQGLTPEMLNTNEGRSSRHNLLIQAFKTFKVRLYGFGTTIEGVRTFVIVEIDPAKKQIKADPKILRRASKRIDQFAENHRIRESTHAEGKH